MTRVVSQKITTSSVECGIAGRALAGQPESGDLSVVAERQHGTLLSVIDGLGHGREAAKASKAAAAVMQNHSQEDLEPLIRLCHGALSRCPRLRC